VEASCGFTDSTGWWHSSIGLFWTDDVEVKLDAAVLARQAAKLGDAAYADTLDQLRETARQVGARAREGRARDAQEGPETRAGATT
jgi:hypothetical protein